MMRHRLLILSCCLVGLLVAKVSGQTQHLVAPGESWVDSHQSVSPGDSIVLMPGEHRPGVLSGVFGTEEQPVVIRPLKAGRPVKINAGSTGIHLARCGHIRIEDVQVVGATIAGILIDDAMTDEQDSLETEVPFGAIELERVTIEATGPKGRRHAVALVGQRDVSIVQCTFTGWGGAAIDVAASSAVTIRDCRLTPQDGHSQAAGVMVRAGSSDITIENNEFGAGMTYGVKLGDRLREEDHRPAPAPDAPEGSLHDAADVRIEENLFIEPGCAVAMSHAASGLVRNNTIVAPTLAAFSLALDHEDPRFVGLRKNAIRGNLITYNGDGLPQLVAVSRPVTRDEVAFGVNLWWGGESADQRKSLAARRVIAIEDHAPQTWEVNPALDDAYHATAADAGLFGMPE